MHILAAYCSPTGTSQKGVLAIANALGEKVTRLDLTRFDADASPRVLAAEDVLVIGAPVYAGRVSAEAMARFSCLRGQDTPCVVTVTYGNRAYDDALLELCDAMAAQGFRVIAAAALIGEHSYGCIEPGRPGTEDLEEDAAFGKRVREKFCRKDASSPAVPGSRPYRDGGRGGRFQPSTDTALCTRCGLCVRDCPAGAIAADCVRIDKAKCLSCFRCLKRCPVSAKRMTSPEYLAFIPGFEQKLTAVSRKNEYYL